MRTRIVVFTQKNFGGAKIVKKTKLIALALVLALAMGSMAPITVIATQSNAADTSECEEETTFRGGICPFCYQWSVLECCIKNVTIVEMGTWCRYGWPWDRKTCTTWHRYRKMQSVCANCKKILEEAGLHHCTEEHVHCGLGTITFCPYTGIMPPMY